MGPVTFNDDVLAEAIFIKCDPNFLSWAFGEGYEKRTTFGNMLQWNKLHSDDLCLNVDMDVNQSLSVMKELWNKRLEEIKKVEEKIEQDILQIKSKSKPKKKSVKSKNRQ